MLKDALSDFVRGVGDDSPPEHKAIFHLWAALDDIRDGRHGLQRPAGQIARQAMEKAARELKPVVDAINAQWTDTLAEQCRQERAHLTAVPSERGQE